MRRGSAHDTSCTSWNSWSYPWVDWVVRLLFSLLIFQEGQIETHASISSLAWDRAEMYLWTQFHPLRTLHHISRSGGQHVTEVHCTNVPCPWLLQTRQTPQALLRCTPWLDQAQNPFACWHWSSFLCVVPVCPTLSSTHFVRVHKLSNLEQLRLAGTNVTDKVLESLRNLSNLQTLDLGRTPLKPKGKWTTWLTYFTTLQALRLDAIPMKDVNSDFLISLSNLQKLVCFHFRKNNLSGSFRHWMQVVTCYHFSPSTTKFNLYSQRPPRSSTLRGSPISSFNSAHYWLWIPSCGSPITFFNSLRTGWLAGWIFQHVSYTNYSNIIRWLHLHPWKI